eukprot:360434-Chlamydomonas_euryale.AAC.6
MAPASCRVWKVCCACAHACPAVCTSAAQQLQQYSGSQQGPPLSFVVAVVAVWVRCCLVMASVVEVGGVRCALYTVSGAHNYLPATTQRGQNSTYSIALIISMAGGTKPGRGRGVARGCMHAEASAEAAAGDQSRFARDSPRHSRSGG